MIDDAAVLVAMLKLYDAIFWALVIVIALAVGIVVWDLLRGR